MAFHNSSLNTSQATLDNSIMLVHENCCQHHHSWMKIIHEHPHLIHNKWSSSIIIHFSCICGVKVFKKVGWWTIWKPTWKLLELSLNKQVSIKATPFIILSLININMFTIQPYVLTLFLNLINVEPIIPLFWIKFHLCISWFCF